MHPLAHRLPTIVPCAGSGGRRGRPAAAPSAGRAERAAAFIADVADVLDEAADVAAATGRPRLAVRHRFAAITVRDLVGELRTA